MTVSFARPSAVVLSVFKGVGGCGWPYSAKQVQMGHATLPLWNRPVNSASDAAETTSFIMLLTHDVHRCIVHGFGVVRLWRLLRVTWLV
jgi:hypothetical protein